MSKYKKKTRTILQYLIGILLFLHTHNTTQCHTAMQFPKLPCHK